MPWSSGSQRAQYPVIKEHTLNYRGLTIMVSGTFLNSLIETLIDPCKEPLIKVLWFKVYSLN